jgi:succinate-acetate transporter protein
MMVSLIQAGIVGTWKDMPVVALFAMTFGGIAQFAAGMWAYRARDGVATLAHGTWGAFWIAFGVLNLFIITGKLPPAPHHADFALGLWFLGLAYITLIAALPALAENIGIFLVLATLAAGSALTSVGWFLGGIGNTWLMLGGYLFISSASLAAYTVFAMSLMSITGRAILPTGELKKAANVPGGKARHPIQLDWGEPGVKAGQ